MYWVMTNELGRDECTGSPSGVRTSLCDKVSRAVIDWCLENGIAEIAIGNVRDIADGKRLHRKSQHPVTQSPRTAVPGKCHDAVCTS